MAQMNECTFLNHIPHSLKRNWAECTGPWCTDWFRALGETWWMWHHGTDAQLAASRKPARSEVLSWLLNDGWRDACALIKVFFTCLVSDDTAGWNMAQLITSVPYCSVGMRLPSREESLVFCRLVWWSLYLHLINFHTGDSLVSDPRSVGNHWKTARPGWIPYASQQQSTGAACD